MPDFEVDVRWERAVWSLAASAGLDGARLADEHYNRAWSRACAGASVEDACAAAYEDIRERFAGEVAA